ncbi:hypothetical protein OHB12_21750 [Nocardia sp. NBC_01730]|uniref:LppU family putative lipoprotein n=1 Tax=Nocardia sp. NBC_01730 TaxID=2975998 RepID=UPI002E100A6D|nr:hypothetical protein OHB12_21750 [Nocardia sp. NBC_01730]
MSRQRIRAGITLTGFVVATALAATLVAFAAMSMSGPTEEPAKAAQNDSAATTSTPPPTTTTEEPVTTTEPPPPTTSAMRGASNKSATNLQVNVGECVRLGGSGGIEKAACGSSGAIYKISEKAPANSPCPTDADRTYTDTLQGAAQAALCLDIDWVVGGCMELITGDPKRLDCAALGTPNGVRVIDIKQNTIDVNACGSADSGIVYRQRHFVVCVARL